MVDKNGIAILFAILAERSRAQEVSKADWEHAANER
jgi:hypothetical protein